jgi:hypothetical protein
MSRTGTNNDQLAAKLLADRSEDVENNLLRLRSGPVGPGG